MSHTLEIIPARLAPAARASRITGTRVLGYLLVGLWLVLGAALLWSVVSNWDIEKVSRYGPRYLNGLATTLALTAISITLGAVLSVPVAFARMAKNPVLNAISYTYVYVFRSTPMLLQIFLIYYGLGSFRPQIEAVGLWWFFREAWYCALRHDAEHGRLSG